MSQGAVLLGLISDAHGLLCKAAVEALRGSELIIHAGDIGKPEILRALRELAPVIAVKGIIDKGSWTSNLDVTAISEVASATIYVLDDLHELDLDPAAAGIHIVIHGHSHKPSRIERSGVLYINPGSAGPRRFQLPVTVARLDLLARPWKVSFVDCSGD